MGTNSRSPLHIFDVDTGEDVLSRPAGTGASWARNSNSPSRVYDAGTGNEIADIANLYSNPLELPFTPVELLNLAVPGDRNDGLSTQNVYRRHELSKRLGSVKVEELVRRARAGESVRSLARELGVANSALTRMLRDEGVAISRRKVSDDEAAAMARQYEAGNTVAELEKKYRLSHGAVLRSLHRSAVEMRPSAPRSKSA